MACRLSGDGRLSGARGTAAPRLLASRPLTRALVAFAALAAVTLTVVVPDQRVLTAAGYLPIVLVGWPWDFPPVSYAEAADFRTVTEEADVLLTLTPAADPVRRPE